MANNRQGLVIDESTGQNIAVTYELRDAKLVAAAPELLRALKDILDMIGPLSDVAMIRRKNSALDAIRLATEESES